MIAVKDPGGVSAYCIDSTEVTNHQYTTWVAKVPALPTQIAQCQWNDSLAPSMPAPDDDLPVGRVDWCDAYLFCSANGKRLCGGTFGGPTPFAEFNSRHSLESARRDVPGCAETIRFSQASRDRNGRRA